MWRSQLRHAGVLKRSCDLPPLALCALRALCALCALCALALTACGGQPHDAPSDEQEEGAQGVAQDANAQASLREASWIKGRAQALRAHLGAAHAECVTPLLLALSREARAAGEGSEALTRLTADLSGAGGSAPVVAPPSLAARCDPARGGGRAVSLSEGVSGGGGARLLWAEEALSVGGWGGGGAPQRTLTLIAWAPTPTTLQLSELGVGALASARIATWGPSPSGERPHLPSRVPLSARAVWLLRFNRPPPPTPSHGGWWAHLDLALPLPHLGYSLSAALPAGWPLAHSGPAPALARRAGGRIERVWHLPAHPLPPQETSLYLSTTPTWGALAAWLWGRLSQPQGVSAAGEVSEAVSVAERGLGALHAWIRARLTYSPAPLRRFDAAPPRDTLARGQGDCKDLSALARAALSGAGREAHLALTALAAPPPRRRPLRPLHGLV